MTHEVRSLFWKEIRQLTRSQGAMLTGLFLPAVLLVLAPVLGVLASRAPANRDFTASTYVPSGLVDVQRFDDFLLYVTSPMLFVIVGLLTPALLASYTVIPERERRSLELLVALPVSLGDIVAAKLVANVAAAAAMIFPMFLVDALIILSLTGAGPQYVVAGLLLLTSTLVASAGATLLMALLARDFRSSCYVSGALAVPPLLVTAFCIVYVPGLSRFVVLSILMLSLAVLGFYLAVQRLTLERYLI